MAKPVQAVDAQIRAWQQSPVEGMERLKECTRAFAACALSLEETLAGIEPRRPWRMPVESRQEHQWRWKRKHAVLFWAATVVLSAAALAAGYFFALGR